MSELPNGWVEAELGEVGHWQGGGTPSKSNPEYWTKGTIPWVSPKDMKTSRISSAEDLITPQAIQGSATNLVPSGTILLVTRSGILKHSLPVAVTDREVAINQDLKALTPSTELEPEFIAQQVRSKARFILRHCTKAGTTVDSVDFKKLQGVSISLPPLAEQERIVAQLDALSARSARARKDLARIDTLVKRYKQAVLSKAFSGELTKDWRDGNNGSLTSEEMAEIAARVDGVGQTRRGARTGTHQIDLKRLADIPSSWAKGIVGVAADILVGFAFKSSWYVESGVKLLRGANIAPGQIDWDDLKSLAPDVAADYSKYKLKRNDIVLAMDRPIISTGLKIAQVAERDEGCLLVQRVARMRPSVYARQSYLWWFMNSADFIAHSVSRSTGSDLPHISGDDISTCPLPLPPLQEQQEIVRRVESAFQKVDTLATEAKRALKLTDKLDEAILVKAFRGELVSQDPNDEPASILLERIKAERAAAPKPKRGRRKKN